MYRLGGILNRTVGNDCVRVGNNPQTQHLKGAILFYLSLVLTVACIVWDDVDSVQIRRERPISMIQKLL